MHRLRRRAPDWLIIVLFVVLTMVTAFAAFEAGADTVPVPEMPLPIHPIQVAR